MIDREKKTHACAGEHARRIYNGSAVCPLNTALCESETAKFKGLIMPAIRFRAAGSLSHHIVDIHKHRERKRGGERMMDRGWRKERKESA